MRTPNLGNICVHDLLTRPSSANAESLTRPYSIVVFPNRALEDDSATVEAEKLQNCVVTQKWI